MPTSFSDYYRSHIQPNIRQLQQHQLVYLQQRANTLRNVQRVLMAIVLLAGLWSVYKGAVQPMIIWLVIAVGGYLLIKKWGLDWWSASSKTGVDFKDTFKAQILLPILHYFDDSLQIDPSQQMPDETIYQSGLFAKAKGYRTEEEDIIQGSYQNCPLKFSEIHITHSVKKEKGTSSETIFNGIFAEITLPHANFSPFYILPEAVFGSFGDLFNMKIFGGSTKEEKIEKRKHNFKQSISAMYNYYWHPDNAVAGHHVQHIPFQDDWLKDKFRVFAKNKEAAISTLAQTQLTHYVKQYGDSETSLYQIAELAAESFISVTPNHLMNDVLKTYLAVAVYENKAYIAIPFPHENLWDPTARQLTQNLQEEITEEMCTVMYRDVKIVMDFVGAMRNITV